MWYCALHPSRRYEALSTIGANKLKIPKLCMVEDLYFNLNLIDRRTCNHLTNKFSHFSHINFFNFYEHALYIIINIIFDLFMIFFTATSFLVNTLIDSEIFCYLFSLFLSVSVGYCKSVLKIPLKEKFRFC